MDLAKLIEWRNRMASIAQRLPFESEKRDVHTMLAELDGIIIDEQERETAAADAIAEEQRIAEEKKADKRVPTAGKTSSTDAAA